MKTIFHLGLERGELNICTRLIEHDNFTSLQELHNIDDSD